MVSIRKKALSLAALAEDHGVLVVLSILGCFPKLSIPLRGSLRDLSVDHLSVTASQADTLRSVGLTTAGRLADFLLRGFCLTSLKDIDPSTSDKLTGELLYLSYASLSDDDQIKFWSDIVCAISKAA